ncbi:flavodoxin family protein [Dyadobacter tibetensis]|uniref:flavodoxin family protein n=1 Tax=Dyadobacter tibetensis TaxID=1211851 RepID=UPI0004B2F85D|nr:NAD(P)H-dependent oxidoreductase [Dyadobacter tibetensis]
MDMILNTIQKRWNEENTEDFSSLSAIFLNCTLKKSPEISNTEGLMRMSQTIMEANGISTQMIRLVDHQIAHGVQPDMTKHGWEVDEWPSIQEKIMAADILVLGTPIWLGDKSSVAAQAIERLYANSAILNNQGQYAYYGKVGGCVVTGNEDGIKHCAMNILYSLQHLGYSIPPQADAGWIGEAGPGPSYLNKEEGGLQNDFTTRNTTFMTWNLMHLAQLLQTGFPSHGNQRSDWDKSDHNAPNPEYR